MGSFCNAITSVLYLKGPRGRIGPENHLARICQDIRDDVAANYACSPVNHALGDATSPSSNDPNLMTAGLTIVVPTDVLRT